MLHYNENNGRNQAENKTGEKRYSIMYPKYKSGGYIVRKIPAKSTYGKLILNSLHDVMNTCRLC